MILIVLQVRSILFSVNLQRKSHSYFLLTRSTNTQTMISDYNTPSSKLLASLTFIVYVQEKCGGFSPLKDVLGNCPNKTNVLRAVNQYQREMARLQAENYSLKESVTVLKSQSASRQHEKENMRAQLECSHDETAAANSATASNAAEVFGLKSNKFSSRRP